MVRSWSFMGSPALGLQVVSVNVIALTDGRDHAAYVLAVLDDRVAYGKIAQRDLVPDRHVLVGYRAQLAVVLRDDAQHVGACLQVFDDDDTDIVTVIVYQEVRGGCHDIRVPMSVH